MNEDIFMSKWLGEHLNFYQEHLYHEFEEAKKKYKKEMNPRKKDLDKREEQLKAREEELAKREKQLQQRIQEVESTYSIAEKACNDYELIIRDIRRKIKEQYVQIFPFVVLNFDYDAIKEKLDKVPMNIIKVLPEHFDILKIMIEQQMFTRL